MPLPAAIQFWIYPRATFNLLCRHLCWTFPAFTDNNSSSFASKILHMAQKT